MELSADDLSRIQEFSTAISEMDWNKLKSLSAREIPNFNIFLQYIDIFGEDILPLQNGFAEHISMTDIPNGDKVFDIPMRTKENERSDIVLVASKQHGARPGELSVDYIFRS